MIRTARTDFLRWFAPCPENQIIRQLIVDLTTIRRLFYCSRRFYLAGVTPVAPGFRTNTPLRSLWRRRCYTFCKSRITRNSPQLPPRIRRAPVWRFKPKLERFSSKIRSTNSALPNTAPSVR